MKKYGIEIKWALIFVLMSLLWMWFEKSMGLHDEHIDKHAIYSNFVAIPAILIYVLALLDKKKNFYNGRMSYKQGFVTGLIITLIVTLLSPLTQWITSNFITPDYFNNVIEYAVKEGEMERSNAESYFSLRSYMIQAFFGAMIMGTLTSAIVAIFTKSKSA